MVDRLVIEIDGNASGLTKALSQAQQRLNTFDNKLQAGNKALTSFIGALNRTAGGLTRLGSGAAKVTTQLTALSNTSRKTVTSLNQLAAGAKSSSASLKTFNTALSGASTRVNAFSTSTRTANTSMNSLVRRMNALATTVTALNSGLRGLVRTTTGAAGGLNSTATAASRAAAATTAAGVAANRAGGQFGRLQRATLSLGENFRRNVAQITALRTLTYQGLFWFAPLLYSIIKTNAAYEKQMVLLKNLSGLQNENARQQWAVQTRQQLVKMANTNPFSLDQITDSFVKIKVAGLDPLNGSMQTLMDSIAAFGGNDEALQRASVAIQQMAGKGVISMEELRQQLGEHIPDAIQAMAQGIGVSVGELYDQIKEGNVEATQALTQMFEVLHLKHRGSAAQMMNTWSGLLARMGTTWQNFVAKLTSDAGQNSFVAKLKEQVSALMDFMNSPAGTNFAISVQNALATIVTGVADVIKWLYSMRETIILIAQIWAVRWGSGLIIGIITRIVVAISGIIKVMRILATTMATTFMLMIGRCTAAQAAVAIFGARTAAAARAVGLLNSAGKISWAVLGGMTLRFGLLAIAAIGAAAAIYAVVRAINAKTAAQINADQAAKARAGGVFESTEERKKERDRVLSLKNSAEQGGEYRYTATGAKYFQKYDAATQARKNKEFEDARQSYSDMVGNTNRLNEASAKSTYGDRLATPFENKVSAIDADYNTKIQAETDHKKQTALRKEQAELHTKLLTSEIGGLKKRLEGSKDPAEQAAIRDRINSLSQELSQDSQSDLIGAGFKLATGEDDGKKKKGGKDKNGFDPLDRFRNKFETEFTQTAEMQNEYMNLVNGTDVIFDQEAAQAEAQKIAAQAKDEESLKKLIVAEQMKQREVEKSLKVQKAIIDLNNETADTNDEVARGYEALALGYSSLSLSSEHYRQQLEREHREELAIVKARMDSGTATEDQIRQYKELTTAINESVHAKEASMLLDLAEEAKQANDEYAASFRTDRGQANYLANIELQKYNDALNMASSALIRKEQERDAIQVRLDEVRARLAEAKAASDQAATDAANADIIVVAQKLRDEDQNLKLIQQSIPYLQERIRILREEEAIRNGMGGFAKPLYDWAKEAAKGWDDLGSSVGKVVSEGFDGLINGLMEGKMAFGDFVKSVMKGLMLMIIRALIAKAILAALGMGGVGPSTGGGGDLNASGLSPETGVFHSGGTVGQRAPSTRTVSAAMFDFAQRYHTGGIVGLHPNEVPIIAEKGERVLSKDEVSSMGKDKGGNVQVNVINQTGVEAKVERSEPKFDGEKWVESIILKKMHKPGPVRDAMRGIGKV